MTEVECAALLDGAAACLVTVAYADPFTTPPTVRLPCLWAVELLGTVGAAPTRWIAADGAQVGDLIREALTMLGRLPAGLFAEAAVLEATAAACAALDANG